VYVDAISIDEKKLSINHRCSSDRERRAVENARAMSNKKFNNIFKSGKVYVYAYIILYFVCI